MGILQMLKRSDPASATPQGEALAAAIAQAARLSRNNSDLGQRAQRGTAEVTRYDNAVAALEAARQRLAEVEADVEISGHTDIDTTGIKREIADGEHALPSLAAAARRGEAIYRKLEAERQSVLRTMNELTATFPALRHAAHSEQLAALAPELIATESAYLNALIRVFGVAGAINGIAEQCPGLRFSGVLPVGDLVFPRPRHDAFRDVPLPDRDDIVARVGAQIAEANKNL